MTANLNQLSAPLDLRIGELQGPAGDGLLPATVGMTQRLGATDILCLAPRRWWLRRTAAALPAEINAYLAAAGGTLVDLTEGIAVRRLAGPNALDILAKGTGIDLHELAFPAGQARRTLHAGVPTVILRGQGVTPRFDLHVDRSLDAHLTMWLAEAGKEYDLWLEDSHS